MNILQQGVSPTMGLGGSNPLLSASCRRYSDIKGETPLG